jgi:uncharacterized protein YfdQ (DUF2303 family)
MQRPDINNRRLVNVSPLFTKPFLRNVLPSENYVQNTVTFIRANLPILHLEMKLAKNAHFQRSEISVEFSTFDSGELVSVINRNLSLRLLPTVKPLIKR